MMRLHPFAAFILVTLVMTMLLGGGVSLLTLDAEPIVSRHGVVHGPPHPILIFSMALVSVAGAGLFVGLPMLALLHWIGWGRRLWALLLAGFLGGALIIVASVVLSGPSVTGDYLVPALVLGGLGMASGFLWWLLTCGAAPARESGPQ